MRWLCVFAVVAGLLSGTARADDGVAFAIEDPVLHTRVVAKKQSDTMRRGRTLAGGTFLVMGGALAGLGVYTYAKAGPNNDWGDELQRAGGITLMVFGGGIAVAGTLALLINTQQERLYDQLEHDIARGDARGGALRLREAIARKADGDRRRRSIVRGFGYTVAGVGLFGVVAGLGAPHSLPMNGDDVVVLGAGLMVTGGAFVLGSLFEGDFEKYERELATPRVPMTAGIVPLRGGAMAGVGLTF